MRKEHYANKFVHSSKIAKKFVYLKMTKILMFSCCQDGKVCARSTGEN
jgi:hypothetical protein